MPGAAGGHGRHPGQPSSGTPRGWGWVQLPKPRSIPEPSLVPARPFLPGFLVGTPSKNSSGKRKKFIPEPKWGIREGFFPPSCDSNFKIPPHACAVPSEGGDGTAPLGTRIRAKEPRRQPWPQVSFQDPNSLMTLFWGRDCSQSH